MARKSTTGARTSAGARSAAERYVADRAFRSIFDSVRAELESKRLETLRAQAAALGYEVVPRQGPAPSRATGEPKAVPRATQLRKTSVARRAPSRARSRHKAVSRKKAPPAKAGKRPSGDRAGRILGFIKDNPGSRKGEIAEGTGFTLGALTAVLRAFRKGGQIVQAGTTRAATYKVKAPG
jgi:hypothetical protein